MDLFAHTSGQDRMDPATGGLEIILKQVCNN